MEGKPGQTGPTQHQATAGHTAHTTQEMQTEVGNYDVTVVELFTEGLLYLLRGVLSLEEAALKAGEESVRLV